MAINGEKRLLSEFRSLDFRPFALQIELCDVLMSPFSRVIIVFICFHYYSLFTFVCNHCCCIYCMQTPTSYRCTSFLDKPIYCGCAMHHPNTLLHQPILFDWSTCTLDTVQVLQRGVARPSKLQTEGSLEQSTDMIGSWIHTRNHSFSSKINLGIEREGRRCTSVSLADDLWWCSSLHLNLTISYLHQDDQDNVG